MKEPLQYLVRSFVHIPFGNKQHFKFILTSDWFQSSRTDKFCVSKSESDILIVGEGWVTERKE